VSRRTAAPEPRADLVYSGVKNDDMGCSCCVTQRSFGLRGVPAIEVVQQSDRIDRAPPQLQRQAGRMTSRTGSGAFGPRNYRVRVRVRGGQQ